MGRKWLWTEQTRQDAGFATACNHIEAAAESAPAAPDRRMLRTAWCQRGKEAELAREKLTASSATADPRAQEVLANQPSNRSRNQHDTLPPLGSVASGGFFYALTLAATALAERA